MAEFARRQLSIRRTNLVIMTCHFVILVHVTVKMDVTDKNLIALLRANSRTSTSDLARKVGVSRSTVQGRIDRLCRQGVIERFTIEESGEYQRSLVRAHVMLVIEQKLTSRAQLALEKRPEVIALYSVSGEYDMIAVVAAESTERLNQLLDDIAALPGVVRTNSSVVLATKLRR